MHDENGTVDNTTENDTAQWYATIGAQRYPEFDVDSIQEAWNRLRMTQLIHTVSDSFSVSPNGHRTTKYIAGINFEKCPGKVGHTGVNTRSGSQLTFHFRNLKSTINTVHVLLHFEEVVNVSAAGVEVLDRKVATLEKRRGAPPAAPRPIPMVAPILEAILAGLLVGAVSRMLARIEHQFPEEFAHRGDSDASTASSGTVEIPHLT
jgi:hypothetical protein